MRTPEKISIVIIFSFVTFGVIISRINYDSFENWYVEEDGIIEWLTVLALFFSSMVCFYRVAILKSFRPSIFIAALIGLGLVCLFGVGEEISWGQRIFNFESSIFFKSFNSQGETNIHNLVINNDIKINKIIFGLTLGILISFYFIALPFLYIRFLKLKQFVDHLAIPVPKWQHAACYLFLVVLSELIPGGKKAEILEFGGCWIFALMLLCPYNAAIFSRKPANN